MILSSLCGGCGAVKPLGLVPEETVVTHGILKAGSHLPWLIQAKFVVILDIAELKRAREDALTLLVHVTLADN